MKLCAFYRLWAELWLGEEQRLPAPIRRHLEGCEDCEGRLNLERRIENQLRAGAEPLQPASSAFLLASRVRSRLKVAEPRPSAVFGLRWARVAALGAGCLALLILGLMSFQPRPQRSVAPGRALELTSPQEVWPATARIAREDWNRWSQALEQPLVREAKLVMEDGRQAVAALVESFVPDAGVEELLPQGME